jgi:hypothetical protein
MAGATEHHAAWAKQGSQKSLPIEMPFTENDLIQNHCHQCIVVLEIDAYSLRISYASNSDWQIRYERAQALGRV